MAMTKKHFKAISKAISEATVASSPLGFTTLDKNLLVSILASIFKRDNPSFSQEKFIEACYELGL